MSFITAPFKEDKGKRIISDASQYTQWDYLKDTRPEAEKKVFPIGTSDGRASKFKVGFYRRPIHKIEPYAARQAHEEVKESFASNTAALRQEKLAEASSRNGNVIVPPAGDEKLFPSRRHFPSRSEAVAEQNHARQKVGASRFHIELNDKEKNYRERAIADRLESQKQTTSVIGYGRNDLPTYGVVDNFSKYQYGQKELLTRPKVKGPPPESNAALIRKGSIQLSDGSGYDFSKHHGAKGSIGTEPKGLQSTVTTSQSSFNGNRRANRSNQTSQGLAQAMSYEHLGQWTRNKDVIRQQARIEASRLPPAGSDAVVPPPVFTQVTHSVSQ